MGLGYVSESLMQRSWDEPVAPFESRETRPGAGPAPLDTAAEAPAADGEWDPSLRDDGEDPSPP